MPQREYDLHIQPDSHNHRYRVWFYFSVSNVRKKQVVLLNITNFSKGKSLYRDGMTPLVRGCRCPGARTSPASSSCSPPCHVPCSCVCVSARARPVGVFRELTQRGTERH